MIGNHLEPFKFWCQKVLPNVYDDSLSYYEYLCKMNDYLNDVIEQINTLTDNMSDYETDLTAQWTTYRDELSAQWQTYKTYIDTYFDNLDVQQEINNKLDTMASDGTLDKLIQPYVNSEIANQVTAWLNENVKPVGSAVIVDNNLLVSGAAADAQVTGNKITDINAKSGCITDVTLPSSNGVTTKIYLKANQKYGLLYSTRDNSSYNFVAYISTDTENAISVGKSTIAYFTPRVSGFLKLWNNTSSGGDITLTVLGETELTENEKINAISGVKSSIALKANESHSSDNDVIPFKCKKDERFRIKISNNANQTFGIILLAKNTEYNIDYSVSVSSDNYYTAKNDFDGIGFYKDIVPTNVTLNFEITKYDTDISILNEIDNNISNVNSNSSFVQGSLYLGDITTNTECIANENYYECNNISKINVIKSNSIYSFRFAFYDKNKHYISQQGYDHKYIYNVPSNAYFYRFAISIASGTDITPSDYDGSIVIKTTINANKAINNISPIINNLNAKFIPSEFTQGSLYNGVLNPDNTECITSKGFYKLNTKVLKVLYDINLNTRITCYDENLQFLSQIGYTPISNLNNYTISTANASYIKISLSLTNVGISETTPSDLENYKIYVGEILDLPWVNKNDIDEIKNEIGIYDKPSNPYKYNGAKIDLSEHSFTMSNYMNLHIDEFSDNESIQGCAVYGNYIFTANNKLSAIGINDLSTKEYVNKITFTAVDTYHCNTISFSNTFLNESDDFPLLYISMENANERKCLVYHISVSNDVWSATLVQTINFPSISDMAIYYPNCVVDGKNELLYISGYTSNSYYVSIGNKIKTYKFALPSTSNATVSLASTDIIDTFEYEALSCTQGMIIKNDKLYQCYGADWTPDRKIYVCVIDLISKEMITKILMNDYGYTTEPEALVIYNNKLYIVSVGGTLTDFTFYD